jgi:glucosamine--fructose-6-phosphate aminotransferase (isomerizing)
VGHREAGRVVIDGLSRLEYRGYDSAGLAIHRIPGRVEVVRSLGATAELSREASEAGFELEGRVAIGHTRWATHGAPSVRNAHPHLSHDGRIALVHNGIIENHAELRREMEAAGADPSWWLSDTDTETLAHWIGHCRARGGGLFEAVTAALQDVVGAYAILALDAETGEMVAARRSSPLAIGVGDFEVLVASDAIPIVEHVRDITYLSDGDVARIIPRGPGELPQVEIFNLGEVGPVERPAVRVELQVEELGRGGHETYMMKEIHEQPDTVRDCLRGRLHMGGDDVVLGGLELAWPSLLRARRIHIVACGTSWHAGLIGRHLIEGLTRVPCEVDYASEFRYRDPIVGPDDVVLAISQSGETADTRAALELAREKGAGLVGVVNVAGSSISRLAGCGIYTRSGVEVGVASTKAFTGQVTALALIALGMARALGTLDRDALEELKAELDTIPSKIAEVLSDLGPTLAAADAHTEARDWLFLGRGISFPVALEGSLKLKEISYAHAEGYPAGEMKHGPIALVEPACPTVFVLPSDAHYEKSLSNLQEVLARSGPVVAVVTRGNQELPPGVGHVIEVPPTHELFSPLLTVVPLQVLAHRVASNRGCNVDRPRNLAKSVTVE